MDDRTSNDGARWALSPAESLRSLALSELHQLSGARATIFADFIEIDGLSYMTSVLGHGAFTRLSALDGAPALAGGPACELPATLAARRGGWTLARPGPALLSGLVRVDDLHLDPAAPRSAPFWCVGGAGAGAGDVVWGLIYDDVSLIGWVGLRFDVPRVAASRRARLGRAWISTGQRLREATHATEAPWANGSPQIAVIAADGTPQAFSEPLRAWLTDHHVAQLQELAVTAHRSPTGASVAAVAGAEARARRLTRDAEPVVHVTLSQPQRHHMGPDEVLTQRQHAVAQLAASGAINAEIAELLGLSINTVKTHLRQAYRALGATNRVELSRLLSGE